MVTTSAISAVIVVQGDILGKIVQSFAGSFCTEYIEVTPSFLSEIFPPTGKVVDIWDATVG